MPPRRSRRLASEEPTSLDKTKQEHHETQEHEAQKHDEGPTLVAQGNLPLQVMGKRRASLVEDIERGPSSKKERGEITVVQKPLEGDALLADLSIDYSSKIKVTQPILPQKQQWKKVKTPITDREKAPKGWNPREPDLMPDDLDAQIERCEERIKENIMPHVYKQKMCDFLSKKKERDAMMAAEPGLNWPVVQRLKSLHMILEWLQSEQDEHKMVDTVQAIISEYRSGVLDWRPGLVTYWFCGTKLCQPRPFKWDEFAFVHDKCNGHTGFWVEGLHNPAPSYEMPFLSFTPNYSLSTIHFVPLGVRCPLPPGYDEPVPMELDFVDDTGCDGMVLYASDVNELRMLGDGPAYPMPRSMGVGVSLSSSGSHIFSLHREFEVNMWNELDNKWMLPCWDRIQMAVRVGKQNGHNLPRLCGNWLRQRLYTATAPDRSNRLWIYDFNPSAPPDGYPVLPTAPAAYLTMPLPPAYTLSPAENYPGLDLFWPAGVVA